MSETVLELLDEVIEDMKDGEFFIIVGKLNRCKIEVTKTLDTAIKELEEADFYSTADKLKKIKYIWTETKV